MNQRLNFANRECVKHSDRQVANWHTLVAVPDSTDCNLFVYRTEYDVPIAEILRIHPAAR
jgi:hypothetical protein